MQSKKPRFAAISDRARLARLTRAELERLLDRAKRAFEAFGTSAEGLETGNADADSDKQPLGPRLRPFDAASGQ
ncbi:MAG TPA: hypothetical protein VFN67_23115 [Polyangiales bacterium]|jgi:hypothetical protein|nr:hypothetical protein [Polyangiales bacterium]